MTNDPITTGLRGRSPVKACGGSNFAGECDNNNALTNPSAGASETLKRRLGNAVETQHASTNDSLRADEPIHPRTIKPHTGLDEALREIGTDANPDIGTTGSSGDCPEGTSRPPLFKTDHTGDLYESARLRALKILSERKRKRRVAVGGNAMREMNGLK